MNFHHLNGDDFKDIDRLLSEEHQVLPVHIESNGEIIHSGEENKLEIETGDHEHNAEQTTSLEKGSIIVDLFIDSPRDGVKDELKDQEESCTNAEFSGQQHVYEAHEHSNNNLQMEIVQPQESTESKIVDMKETMNNAVEKELEFVSEGKTEMDVLSLVQRLESVMSGDEAILKRNNQELFLRLRLLRSIRIALHDNSSIQDLFR